MAEYLAFMLAIFSSSPLSPTADNVESTSLFGFKFTLRFISPTALAFCPIYCAEIIELNLEISILTQTKEYGLPEVEFIDMENALRVYMYRAFSNDEKQKIRTNDKSKRQTINTNDNDKQKTAKEYAILEYLGRVDKAKTVDIAAVIGLGPDRTRVILASMAKRNMIVAEGANRNRIYRLPQTILMVALWLQKVIKSKKSLE